MLAVANQAFLGLKNYEQKTAYDCACENEFDTIASLLAPANQGADIDPEADEFSSEESSDEEELSLQNSSDNEDMLSEDN